MPQHRSRANAEALASIANQRRQELIRRRELVHTLLRRVAETHDLNPALIESATVTVRVAGTEATSDIDDITVEYARDCVTWQRAGLVT